MKKIYLVVFILILLLAAFYSYEKREAKILFVGDMFFDRYIRQVSDKKGGDFIFSCIDNFLKDSDLVVGNLEGSITDSSSVSVGTEAGSPENFIFTFPPATAKLLAKNNIKMVNIGNNHIGNFGEWGIASTKKYLNEAGVNYFGNESIYRTKMGGTNISFVSYNEFNGDSAQKVAQKISDEKKDGQMVFVYAHWGDEYSGIPQRVKDTANLFAKSGANLIIGSHPHIILPSESFDFAQDKKTVVYYSLGNFIFDQYWNKDVSTGLVLEVHIGGGSANRRMKIIKHKVSLTSDGKTCLVK